MSVGTVVANVKCADCKHWLEAHQFKACPIAGQWVPAAKLIAAGQMPADAPVRDVAACTFLPLWQTMDGEHWCSQFEARATQ